MRTFTPFDYAGDVACEMGVIMDFPKRYFLFATKKDAAKGIVSECKGMCPEPVRYLGYYSFHETKNINSCAGGALFINDPGLAERGEFMKGKVTDQVGFMRGQVNEPR